MYTPFQSDLIHNMDHMHISGTESSSVIQSITKKFQKLEFDIQKTPKQAQAKRDVVINPENYNYLTFNSLSIVVMLQSLFFNHGQKGDVNSTGICSHLHFYQMAHTNQYWYCKLPTDGSLYMGATQ